jgi:hypothetical protein
MLTRRRCCCGTASCQLCVTVTDCSGAALSGATVTITQGVTTIGTCTTNGSGQCCVNVSSSGSYVATVTLSGYTGSNKTVSVTCPAGESVTLVATPNANRHRFSATSPCDSAGIPGVIFTINGGSYTTDSSGFAYYAVPAGTYAWTATSPYPGLSNASGTKVHFNCFTSNWGHLFALASGWICVCDCTRPIDTSESLSLTDSVVGTCSLTWSATDSRWEGTISDYSFPGYCTDCVATTTDVEYWFGSGGSCEISVRYKVKNTLLRVCPDKGTGWYWFTAPKTSVTTDACTPSLAVTQVMAKCDCIPPGPPNACTATDNRILYAGSTSTITLTQ